jgi:succinate dehydrogenase flavin-adding protein (antitoxin of CptAB toxin-antitoxin module)
MALLLYGLLILQSRVGRFSLVKSAFSAAFVSTRRPVYRRDCLPAAQGNLRQPYMTSTPVMQREEEAQLYRDASIALSDPLCDYRMRLLYRSTKNGILENDIILGDFARANIATLTEKQLNEFEELLQENDWDIYKWSVKPLAEATIPVAWQNSEILPLLRQFVEKMRAKIF